MYRRAVDKELSVDIFFESNGKSVLHGSIVSYTSKDYVRLWYGFVDAGDDAWFPSRKGCAKVNSTLFTPVEQDKGAVKVSLLYEVLAHALRYSQPCPIDPTPERMEPTRPIFPRPIHASRGAMIARMLWNNNEPVGLGDTQTGRTGSYSGNSSLYFSGYY